MDYLVVYPRNLVPMVGENGAGKSDFLRALDMSLSLLDFVRSEDGANRLYGTSCGPTVSALHEV